MAAILRVKDENGNIVSIPAIKGDKGEKGDKGDRGLPGSGGVPDGGTTGQVLTKNSNADGDAGWKDSSGAEFSDDGSGNISVNGASSNAKRFLNSLTVPGLDYKYVNPINSGTYTSPYGVYISSGTVIDYVVGLTQVGFYTAYVNRKVTDIPDAAKAANSSLRGFVCVSQIDNTASGGSTKCYAYIVLIDQNSNFYIQYIQSSTGGGWKRMYPYETAESVLMEKLDKNQGTANSGKFLGIGADGIIVPTEVNKQWKLMFEHIVTDEDVTNKVAQFQYFDDSIDAEDVMIIIDWKTQSNSNLVITASNKGSNWNYIANIVNGFGVRNNQKDVWHIHCEKISDDLRILEYSRRLGATGNENSDFNSGRLSGSESKRIANAKVNGVRIIPYGWAKIDGNYVEYGLLAGTAIKVFWR